MTVYELIQELAQYAPNNTITFQIGNFEGSDCTTKEKQWGFGDVSNEVIIIPE